MNKKVVVLGGGTGLSFLLRGLKQFPVDITAIVSVCDDGRSTGRLRSEFNLPAMGDLRQVLISLSETEPVVGKLLNYRFKTTSDLNGHPVGNLLLTAAADMTGNMGNGVRALSKVLDLKGKVLPFSEDDNITLMAEMTDGSIVEGEHRITQSDKRIKRVFYKDEPKVSKDVLKAIHQADLIVLSMGSVFTSVIPNLLSQEIIEEIDMAKAPIMYCCNMFTQPGETDDLTASDHIKVFNSYLGEKKISVGIFNKEKMDPVLVEKYSTEEQKWPVVLDRKNLHDIEVIADDLVIEYDGAYKHDTLRLAFLIFEYLMRK
ncbi:MAG: YvcK family protein [Bacilli bacterium]|nr:YvcK family protein [Bacilli bacterium]